MVVGQGWTPVRELRKGDELVRPDGSTVTVHSVDATGETATVYNFEVEGLHDYYVQIGCEWVLVHNGDCGLVNLASPSRTAHILDGEVRPNGSYGGGHRSGTGFPKKSEFPSSWSDDQVMHHVSDVATDPASPTRPAPGGGTFASGTRDGVDIDVLVKHDEIWTAYPTNVTRNP